jgi:hypothetical protein
MNAVLFIETRPKARIPEVINDHLQYLPDDFELIVYCSKQNKANFYGINAKFNIVEIHSLRDYNYLLTSLDFWKPLIKYNRVLITQFDSMLLREGIEDFYQWDYVGAPWKFQQHGGNGGLSLRNPRIMKEIIEVEPYHPSHGYEDVYFSNRMNGYQLAPRDVCSEFSCETIFKLGTLGYHAIHNYMNNEQINEIKHQYKESGRLAS